MTNAKPAANNNKTPSHAAGHRARLRERFIQQGGDALADYELLEMLLFGAIPQRDTKPMAKELIKEFGSLEGVLRAPTEQLQKKFPAATAIIATLRLPEVLAIRLMKNQFIKRPVFSAWQQVLDYCQLAMANLPHEELRLLFLDHKNTLIWEEMHQRGTVDHTPAYPREIVKRALDKGATAILMVHNHPSGDPFPSKQDIELTNQVKKAGEALGIALHDHIIIGKGAYVSFKAEGLI